MNTLKSFFPHLDMASEAALLLPLVGGLLLLLLAAWLSGAVFRRVVTPLILKVVARTHAVWDDYIFNRHVLGSASHVVPGCVFYLFLPFVFGDEQALSFPDFHELLLRGTRVYITVTVVRLFCAFFSNVGRLTSQEEDFNAACQDAARDICQCAKAQGMPIEFNLLGLLSQLNGEGRGYPSPAFWNYVKPYVGDVIIGVDAHDPAQLSYAPLWEEGQRRLRALGYTPLDHLTWNK